MACNVAGAPFAAHTHPTCPERVLLRDWMIPWIEPHVPCICWEALATLIAAAAAAGWSSSSSCSCNCLAQDSWGCSCPWQTESESNGPAAECPWVAGDGSAEPAADCAVGLNPETPRSSERPRDTLGHRLAFLVGPCCAPPSRDSWLCVNGAGAGAAPSRPAPLSPTSPEKHCKRDGVGTASPWCGGCALASTGKDFRLCCTCGAAGCPVRARRVAFNTARRVLEVRGSAEREMNCWPTEPVLKGPAGHAVDLSMPIGQLAGKNIVLTCCSCGHMLQLQP